MSQRYTLLRFYFFLFPFYAFICIFLLQIIDHLNFLILFFHLNLTLWIFPHIMKKSLSLWHNVPFYGTKEPLEGERR